MGSCAHYQPHEHVGMKSKSLIGGTPDYSNWPRTVREIECPNCDGPVAVMQTSYGARAICRPCGITWTTLFNEERTWTDERYSPITDNTTRGRDVEDALTAEAGRRLAAGVRDRALAGGDGR